MYSGNENDNNYKVLDRIKENIIDRNSRYLLTISKSILGIFLIKSILPETKKDYNLYLGSPFFKDRNNEEYFLKILNKIQLHMQEGRVLILKNLGSIYPLLYDLFNQNFTRYSEKNYARIAAGPFVNDFTLVHDEFRCIVDVNNNQIKEEEPPFLNRFEKHIISLDNCLTKDLVDESLNIYNKLKEMIKLDKNAYKGISYDLEKIFINFNLEEIQAIMYEALQRKVDKEQMFDKVIEKISLTLPQDIILCLKLNGFSTKNPDLLNKIIKAYNKGQHHNLRRFLKSMKKKKNIIYTYTDNLEEIKITEKIDNKIVGKISKENIREMTISECKSENDLEKEIDKFYEAEKEKICFIKFNSNEGHLINYVQFFIENKQKELFGDKNEENNNKKIFIFIVNLVRIYDNEIKGGQEQKVLNKKMLKETTSNLSTYYQIFIDNLYGSDAIKIESIFSDEGFNIYENFFDLNDELTKNFYMILSSRRPNTLFSEGKLNDETYINKLIEYICNNDDIKTYINNCVKKIIRITGNLATKDIIKEIFKKENRIKKNDKDIIGIITKNLTSEYTNYLARFYFKAEKDNFFANLIAMGDEKDPIKFNEEQNTEKIKTYFKEFKIDKNDELFKNEGQNLINMDFRVFEKFYTKYPQVDLDNEEKEKIISYIQKLYTDEKYDFKQLFASMKLLIFFLSNNNLPQNQDLKIVINEKPDYLKLDEKCDNLFLENNISIKNIMDIYFYVEHLSFMELSQTLDETYKNIIVEDDLVETIKNKLKDKKENGTITWEQLAAVIRRFISRCLIGGKKLTSEILQEIKKFELVSQLYRTDLWEEKFLKLDNLNQLIKEKIGQFNFNVSQALRLYEIIGEEDRNSILITKTNEININDHEEDEEENLMARYNNE